MTAQAVRALNDTDVLFAMDKGEARTIWLVAAGRLRRFIGPDTGSWSCRIRDEPRSRSMEGAAGDYARGPSSIGMPNARGCGPTPSSPNSVPTVSEPSWLG